MLLTILSLPLLGLVQGAFGHGDHQEGARVKGENIQQYAQRHMSSEHHIDSFDARSFFHLHDLDRDGLWQPAEIEAIYGVHHVYSQKKTKDDEERQRKAEHIVKAVLDALDKNKDGVVTPEELEAVGLDGLPNFDGLGAEGHHYDVESEFFLHHEEQFHSTPETQTDESYNHPEDLEHFAQHEEIEKKEAEREAEFQGISVEEVLKQMADAAKAAEGVPDTKTIVRQTPPEKQEPEVKFKDAKTEAERKGEWGSGPDGYKPPVNPGDRMRRNTPYKYKFRRSWGDF